MAVILKFPLKSGHGGQGRCAGSAALADAPAQAPACRENKSKTVNKKRGKDQEDDQRRAMIAKVHMALPSLYRTLEGFNEDVYRFTLQERWGVDSSAKMTRRQLHELLLWFSELGFKFVTKARPGRRGSKGVRKDAPALLEGDSACLGRTELMEKIEAMLAEKGRAEGTDVPWGYAVAILKRQSGGVIKTFDHAMPDDLRGVIAALHRDAKRKGRRVR